MDKSKKKRVNIYLSEDTVERLKQYAWENHTSVSHAIAVQLTLPYYLLTISLAFMPQYC